MTGLKLSEVHDDDVLTPKTGRAGPVYLLRNYRTPIPGWLQGRDAPAGLGKAQAETRKAMGLKKGEKVRRLGEVCAKASKK
jgi:hypothetical protein